ncbi:MAG: hypothetical protein ACI8YQ_002192 [Polaribacter sp.]
MYLKRLIQNRLVKASIELILIGLILVGLYTVYLFSRFNTNINQQSVIKLISSIKESKKHDKGLIKMYDRIHDNSLSKSALNHLIEWSSGKHSNHPCFEVVRNSFINTRHDLAENDFAITIRIEKELSQTDCLNYLLEKQNFLYGTKGVEEAAEFYFNKRLENLHDDQLIGLIIMMENPSLYNPKRRKKLLDEKIMEMKLKKNI